MELNLEQNSSKDGACSSKDALSSSKAAEGVSRLLKQYQINSLFCVGCVGRTC